MTSFDAMNEVKPDGAASADWQGAALQAKTLGLKTSDLGDQRFTGSRRQPDSACLLQPSRSAKARTRVKTLLPALGAYSKAEGGARAAFILHGFPTNPK